MYRDEFGLLPPTASRRGLLGGRLWVQDLVVVVVDGKVRTDPDNSRVSANDPPTANHTDSRCTCRRYDRLLNVHPDPVRPLREQFQPSSPLTFRRIQIHLLATSLLLLTRGYPELIVRMHLSRGGHGSRPATPLPSHCSPPQGIHASKITNDSNGWEIRGQPAPGSPLLRFHGSLPSVLYPWKSYPAISID